MATPKLYMSTTSLQSGTQPDHCVSEQPQPCEPQCLVQPRFFCGQLLTDQDLSALLQWSEGKFKLNRFKHGWGVVNGLRARCNPANTASVMIMPGYAVDSCGNDIVVCEPVELDLSNACRPLVQRCEQDTATEDPNACDQFLGLAMPEGSCYSVDIYIHYSKEDMEPLPALGRGACGEREACEFSRSKETFTLSWQDTDYPENQLKNVLQQWEHKYFKYSNKVVKRISGVIEGLANGIDWGNLPAIKNAFLDWLDEHPLHEFCFLRDAICQLSQENIPDLQELEKAITAIMFWIVMDRRVDYLSKWPVPTPSTAGVPLARVHLQRRGDSPSTCHVLHIDNIPLHNRPLMQDRWPAIKGEYNLGQLIGHYTEHACYQLHDKMIHTETRNMQLETQDPTIRFPETIQAINDWLDYEWDTMDIDNNDARQGLFANTGCHTNDAAYSQHNIVAITYDFGADAGERVVAFRQADYGEGAYLTTNTQKQNALRVIEKQSTQAVESQVEPAEHAIHDVKGIGKSYETTLAEKLGITTLSQLAEASLEDLQKTFPKMSEEVLKGWQQQAKDLI